MRTAAVYVHGLWMVGMEGALLRRRLGRALGAKTPYFRYRSVASDLDANARKLASELSRLSVDRLHLVGHSLGGLVILKLFELKGASALPPGRVVLLGSPVGGSRAARALAGWWCGGPLLGRSVADSLLQPVQRTWPGYRELGVIAGNVNIGLGRLVNTHIAPSDGTVYVDETEIDGMREHIVVPVSHTALPLSSKVAALSTRFLRDGTFGLPRG